MSRVLRFVASKKLANPFFINSFWNLLSRVARKKNVLPAEKILKKPLAVDEQFVTLKSRSQKK